MANGKATIELTDIWLSTFVTVQTGQEPQLVFRDGTGYFCFKDDPMVLNAIKDFQSNGIVRVFDYITSFKRLRGKLYAGKNGKFF
jgi:hypothetical protein